jgi:medium-chain acyl-[acyl-carrier-protein] hydrolase
MNLSPWFTCFHPKPQSPIKLFCFPHGGGSANAFIGWSKYLQSEDIEVFAFQLPGRGARFKEPFETSLESVSDGISKLLGPIINTNFYFFGHSLGGLVAYETARKLQRYFAYKPNHLFLATITPPHLIKVKFCHLSEDDFLPAIQKHYGTIPTEIINNLELRNLFLPVLRADFRLLETYEYYPGEPLSCPITLFCGDRDPAAPIKDLETWKDYTSSTFQTRIFSGDHMAVYNHYMQILDTMMSTCLGKTKASSG